MVATTLNGVMLTGNHASRPAATAVAKGALYACSTHSLIYQSDASSWSTWATLTGTGLTDPMTTRGDIIIRDATNTSARLGRGSAGTVLTSDGTDVSWAAAGSGGALVLLEQHTALSSATLDFTTFISSTYDEYIFEFLALLPATAGADLNWRAGTGGGPTYDSTSGHYVWTDIFSYVNTGGGEGNGTNQTAGVIAGQCSTGTLGLSGHGRLIDPQNASNFKPLFGQVTYYHNSVGYIQRGYTAVFIQSTAMTAARFLYSSGNIASGTIRCYGVAKS